MDWVFPGSFLAISPIGALIIHSVHFLYSTRPVRWQHHALRAVHRSNRASWLLGFIGMRFVSADPTQVAGQFSSSGPATNLGSRAWSSSGRGRDDCHGRVGRAPDPGPDGPRTGPGRPLSIPLLPPPHRLPNRTGTVLSLPT